MLQLFGKDQGRCTDIIQSFELTWLNGLMVMDGELNKNNQLRIKHSWRNKDMQQQKKRAYISISENVALLQGAKLKGC